MWEEYRVGSSIGWLAGLSIQALGHLLVSDSVGLTIRVRVPPSRNREGCRVQGTSPLVPLAASAIAARTRNNGPRRLDSSCSVVYMIHVVMGTHTARRCGGDDIEEDFNASNGNRPVDPAISRITMYAHMACKQDTVTAASKCRHNLEIC